MPAPTRMIAVVLFLLAGGVASGVEQMYGYWAGIVSLILVLWIEWLVFRKSIRR